MFFAICLSLVHAEGSCSPCESFIMTSGGLARLGSQDNTAVGGRLVIPGAYPGLNFGGGKTCGLPTSQG
jgi:hypothetical protein